MSNSQYGEEQFLSDYFHGKNEGFCVDVGANDGVKGSNSRALFEKGWEGICVDANPECYEALVRLYPCGSKVRAIHAGTSDFRADQCEFFVEQTLPFSELSSMEPGWVASLREDPRFNFKSVAVPIIHIEDILTQETDLLLIDTEGSDSRIIRAMKLQEHRPKLIMAEIDKWNALSEIAGFLYDHKYRFIWGNPVNGCWERT